jgi:UDP-glucose 6-dehydrogenase
VKALAALAERFDYHPELLHAVMAINRDQRMLAIDKLRECLETLEGRTVELRIPDNVAGRVDERDAMTCRLARLIGEGIRIDAGSPLRRQKPRFAREIVYRLLGDSGVKLVIDDDDDRHHHHRDDRERLQEEPVGELHARSGTFLIR